MKKVLLISHGHMARGIVSSVDIILGKQDNLEYLSAYVEGEPPFENELKKIIDDNRDNDLIILTDLLGGSVNNEVMSMVDGKDNIHLITGMNLILVISILLADDSNLPEQINKIIDESRKGIIYFNDSTIIQDEGLDDF
ncbi:PTS sugar transporter subunit IIA [Anaerococcus provencensis]|uniref:PTS sugar transporter subunit IIA n=1 Tax=Anaerococcus provencensis TaxID=938293 RepID=UPI0002E07D55|nr:hypothetical protein [Anaerococcus provencensis]